MRKSIKKNVFQQKCAQHVWGFPFLSFSDKEYQMSKSKSINISSSKNKFPAKEESARKQKGYPRLLLCTCFHTCISQQHSGEWSIILQIQNKIFDIPPIRKACSHSLLVYSIQEYSNDSSIGKKVIFRTLQVLLPIFKYRVHIMIVSYKIYPRYSEICPARDK